MEPGEVVALLGPNGAGKTTTLLTIAGLLPIISGTVDVLGAPVAGVSAHIVARRGLALLPRGEQQMLALGCRLIADPKVLMIDEMSLGLAPIIVARLLPVVRRIADETGAAELNSDREVLASSYLGGKALDEHE